MVSNIEDFLVFYLAVNSKNEYKCHDEGCILTLLPIIIQRKIYES